MIRLLLKVSTWFFFFVPGTSLSIDKPAASADRRFSSYRFLVDRLWGYSTVTRDLFNIFQEFFFLDLMKDFYAELFTVYIYIVS